VGEVSRLSFGP